MCIMNHSAIRLKLTQHCNSTTVQNETFLNKVKQKKKKERKNILYPNSLILQMQTLWPRKGC